MGLIKAIVKADEAGVNLTVQFNPKELSVDRSVSWTPKPKGKDNPPQEFKDPQSASLSCTFYFDTYETKKDVYTVGGVKELEKTVLMKEGLGRPPKTIFSWGSFTFEGVVESLSQKYTMFLEDGTRVRCEVGFKMKSSDFAPTVASGTSGSSG